jgi:hypothetical protein
MVKTNISSSHNKSWDVHGQKGNNKKKLYMFLFLFKKDIGLEVVQDIKVINNNVTMFIFCTHQVLVEIEVGDTINSKCGNLGFVMTLVFQQIIELKGQKFFFPFHECIYHTTNLMDFVTNMKTTKTT